MLIEIHTKQKDFILYSQKSISCFFMIFKSCAQDGFRSKILKCVICIIIFYIFSKIYPQKIIVKIYICIYNILCQICFSLLSKILQNINYMIQLLSHLSHTHPFIQFLTIIINAYYICDSKCIKDYKTAKRKP